MASVDKLLDDIQYVSNIHIRHMKINNKSKVAMNIKMKNLITEGNCIKLGIQLKLEKSLED